MAADYIGWWMARLPGKWHLVESEITDRLVSHCGRQMRLQLHDVPLVFDQQPRGDVCVFCATRGRK